MQTQVYEIDFSSGKLISMSSEGKNNLPIGTILHLHGYNEPDYLIISNTGTMYRVINLDTFQDQYQEYFSLYWPSENRKGIHVEITDNHLTESQVQDIIRHVALAKIEQEKEAQRKAEARATEIERLKTSFPHLAQEVNGAKLRGPTLAAHNIRIELKRAFPGHRFSVTSKKYSGGDSVDVSWTDGPTQKEVESITGKYQEGHFNGMEDIYEYNHENLWPDIYGGAKYVCEQRHFSREFVEKIAAQEEIPITWNVYGGYEVRGEELHDINSRRHWLDRGLSETSAYVKPADKTEPPAPDTVDGVTVTINTEKQGIEVRFPSRPAQSIIDSLKANGWRWSRFNGCWYNKANDTNLIFANNLKGATNG